MIRGEIIESAVHSFMLYDKQFSAKFCSDYSIIDVNIYEVNYKQCYKYKVESGLREITILFEASYGITFYNGNKEITLPQKEWFELYCCGTLSEKFQDFSILKVEVYDKVTPSHDHTLDEHLVPYYSNSYLDEVVTKILSTYYSETLEQPMPIDACELARRI